MTIPAIDARQAAARMAAIVHLLAGDEFAGHRAAPGGPSILLTQPT